MKELFPNLPGLGTVVSAAVLTALVGGLLLAFLVLYMTRNEGKWRWLALLPMGTALLAVGALLLGPPLPLEWEKGETPVVTLVVPDGFEGYAHFVVRESAGTPVKPGEVRFRLEVPEGGTLRIQAAALPFFFNPYTRFVVESRSGAPVAHDPFLDSGRYGDTQVYRLYIGKAKAPAPEPFHLDTLNDPTIRGWCPGGVGRVEEIVAGPSDWMLTLAVEGGASKKFVCRAPECVYLGKFPERYTEKRLRVSCRLDADLPIAWRIDVL